MRRKKQFLHVLVDALLICCGALAVVFTLPTAYSVSFEISTLVYATALFSLFISFVLRLKKLSPLIILLFLLAVGLYVYFDRHSVKMGFRILYYSVMRPPTVIFPFLPMPTEPKVEPLSAKAFVTSFLIAVSAVFSVLIGFSTVKSGSPILSILCVLPSVFLSMVYTDCSPALYSVILLVIYIGGVLLGSGIRGTKREHAVVRLVFLALLTLLAFAIRRFSPEKSYVPIPYEQRQYILGERFGLLQDGVLSLFSRNPRQYNLGSIGDRVEQDKKAFAVRSTATGSFLLRTHSYGLYDKNSFLPSPEYSGEWNSLHALGLTQRGEYAMLRVQGAIMSERVVPYAFMPDSFVKVEEGFVRAYGETSYVWQFKPNLRFTPIKSGKEESDYYLFALNNYTMPAGPQKEELRKLMNESFPLAISSVRDFTGLIEQIKLTDHYAAARVVADSVRSFGEYTLLPGATPQGWDLVQYFMKETKRGYCVHFASATAAFLQALDIPARFVIGYRADVTELDEWQDIPQKASHAWVEVYVKGVGWVPIECTPGFPGGDDYVPDSPSFPEPTATPEPTPSPTPDPNAPETEPPETELPSIRPSIGPRETPTARPSPSPNQGGSGGKGGSGGSKGGAWLWLLIPIAVIALWQLAGFIMSRIRKHRFEQSDSSAAVIAMLRYLGALERYGLVPEPNSKEVGEEAAFSNHPMSEKQRELLTRCRRVHDKAFKNEPLKRLFLRWMIFKL